MKKEYHGFRIEKVDISAETIIVSSLGSCALTHDYMQEGTGLTSDSIPYHSCIDNSWQEKPYPYNNMA